MCRSVGNNRGSVWSRSARKESRVLTSVIAPTWGPDLATYVPEAGDPLSSADRVYDALHFGRATIS
jgi:hypothetical protein